MHEHFNRFLIFKCKLFTIKQIPFIENSFSFILDLLEGI